MSHSPAIASNESEAYTNGWAALFDLLYSGGSLSGRERNCCFLNPGESPFVDISAVSGFDFADDGRALGRVDWDHDGRLDVWAVNRTSPRARFLKNVSTHNNNFLSFRLIGTDSNRDAIGARIKLKLKDGRELIRTLSCGAGYLSQSSKWVHFGLGDQEADSVLITWPAIDKQPELFELPQTNCHYELVEGGAEALVLERFNSRRINLQEKKLAPELPSDTNRIVLAGRVPIYPFQYEDERGEIAIEQVQTGSRPVLINFWASWCLPCVSEIKAFADSEELDSLVRVLLLSGDKRADRPAALSIIKKTNWQRTHGFATAETLDYFDTIQQSLLSHQQPMPIPTSFLIDQNGMLVAIYQGKVEIDQLISDLELCNCGQDEIWRAAVPFSGRWFKRPDAAAYSQIAIATRFTKLGRAGNASKYLAELTDRIDPVPMSEDAEARMTLAGAQVNLASRFYELGDVERAISLLDQAIRFSPHFEKAHFNLGVIQQQQGNTRAAVLAFEAALNSDPNHAYSNFNLGTIYESNQPKMAENFYERAIEANPKFTQARYNLGLLLLKQGQLRESKEQFDAILSYQVDSNAHYQLGNVAIKSNDMDAAIVHFEESIEIDGLQTEAMTNLASIMFSRQEFDRALELLQKVATVKKDDAKSQLNYAIALLQSGNHAAAIERLKATLKLEPEYPGASLRLAQAIVMNPDSTIQELQEAIRLAQHAALNQPGTANAAATILDSAKSRLEQQ